MRFYIIISIFLMVITGSCRKIYEAPVPDLQWALFDAPSSVNLSFQSKMAMEGVYNITEEDGVFGELAALKWSYVMQGADTVYHLSILCGKDVSYFIMQGKKSGDSILLNGYWRKMINTETGVARMSISNAGGAGQLFSTTPLILKDSIVINGVFGYGSEEPVSNIKLEYDRRLFNGNTFEILAHRAGGRTSDLLPYSENSIGMIKFASQLGATGIEIDVKKTKDNISILYHDNTLNTRLIQKNGLVGEVEKYTYDQLFTQVRLIDGQRIPTLRDALHTIVYETDLRYVWLDVKYEASFETVRQLQIEFLQKASAAGRQIEIVIGLPTEDALQRFKELPDYRSVPSLYELDLSDAENINARVWAPRWTLGLQNEEVARVKAAGKKAFVWTLDVPEFVENFINQGSFDGILSNYPSLVAYYYYVKQ
ncbi:MAG: glycerophosphodiester phosphodiesterase [Chitinophagaceae bacterium]